MGEQNLTKTETIKDELKVSTAPATAVIPAETVAEMITGRLTTLETETQQDGKTIGDRLLTVKSIVTLALAICFVYLSITGAIQSEQFMTIFSTVIAFYFGVQTAKQKE